MLSTRTVSLFVSILFAVGSLTGVAQDRKLPAGFDTNAADVYPQFFVGEVAGTEFRARWAGTSTSDQVQQVSLLFSTQEFTPVPASHLKITGSAGTQVGAAPSGTRPAFLQVTVPVEVWGSAWVDIEATGAAPAGGVQGFMVVEASSHTEFIHSFGYDQVVDDLVVGTTPVPHTRGAVEAVTTFDTRIGSNVGLAFASLTGHQLRLTARYDTGSGLESMRTNFNVFGQDAFTLAEMLPDVPDGIVGQLHIELLGGFSPQGFASPFWVTSLDFFTPPLSDRVLIFGKDVSITPCCDF